MEDYKISLISKMVMSTAIDLMQNDSYKEIWFSSFNNYLLHLNNTSIVMKFTRWIKLNEL
jgi:hypothetical protein